MKILLSPQEVQQAISEYVLQHVTNGELPVDTVFVPVITGTRVKRVGFEIITPQVTR